MKKIIIFVLLLMLSASLFFNGYQYDQYYELANNTFPRTVHHYYDLGYDKGRDDAWELFHNTVNDN